MAKVPESFNAVKNHIGSALLYVRVRRKIQRERLADALRQDSCQDVNTDFIALVEGGKQSVTFEMLRKICKALGCGVPYVMRVANFLQKKSP